MMIDPAWALAGLAVSAFLSSTLLPGNSELALAGFLAVWPGWLWPALIVATMANSAGGATSFWLGRAAPPKRLSPRWQACLQRFGTLTLLASWVPVVGDLLTVAAGWLRFPFWSSTLWMTVGKAGRYLAIAAVVPGVSLLG
jgi:membrane protein YqaA with SNARE-associated domain